MRRRRLVQPFRRDLPRPLLFLRDLSSLQYHAGSGHLLALSGAAGLSWLGLSGCAAFNYAAADAPAEPKMDPAGLEFFEKNVRPIFTERCYECHSKEKGVSKGGLIMDSRAGLLSGGDLGPAVVPGDIKKSMLILAVHQTDPDLSMPPRKKGAKLSDAQIASLEQWIKMGAPVLDGGGWVCLVSCAPRLPPSCPPKPSS